MESGSLLVIPHLSSHQLRAHNHSPYVRSVLCLPAESRLAGAGMIQLLDLPLWKKVQCLNIGAAQTSLWKDLLERMAQLASMVLNGVFEKFNRLRVKVENDGLWVEA